MTNQPTADPFSTSSSAPAIKFTEPGEVHVIVVRKVDEKNDTAPDGTTKTWSNGDPKKVWVFSGEDEGGDPAALWVRGNLVKVVREARDKAGLKTMIDTKVTVKFTAFGTAEKGMNAPKLFAAKVEAVGPVAALAGDDDF